MIIGTSAYHSSILLTKEAETTSLENKFNIPMSLMCLSESNNHSWVDSGKA